MSLPEDQLTYGHGRGQPLAFQRARACGLTLEAVVARLRQAIAEGDAWLLHEIDPQALLSRDGRAIGPARQLLWFHPRYMTRLLAADAAALLEAPLKFAVLEEAGATIVRWQDPAQAFARYGDPALTALGDELATLAERIADQALGAAQ